ncbi:hypothetical protein [Phycicoccus jejuensis]|uniref:hypothetical protein n=1 Tax=Phycicoccus jejuensis TaxID=367299 RepID=UPI003CCBC9C1
MTGTQKHLLVLGAGTAGTMIVNKLRKRLPREAWTITVVDRDDVHDYQPGYLFIPFGITTPEQVRRTRRPFIHDGVDVVMGTVERVDTDAHEVRLEDGRVLPWDQLVFVTPLDGAFTKPVASRTLGSLLEEKGITVETDFMIERIDQERKVIVSFDEREVAYDQLVTVPLNMGADFVGTSGLGDELNYVPVDKHTFLAHGYDDVFALGDASNIPTSKAGSVAHFSVEVFVENFVEHVAGRPMTHSFDGHANCFVESGHGKALLLDVNYDTEPLTGTFPTERTHHDDHHDDRRPPGRGQRGRLPHPPRRVERGPRPGARRPHRPPARRRALEAHPLPARRLRRPGRDRHPAPGLDADRDARQAALRALPRQARQEDGLRLRPTQAQGMCLT